METVKHLRSEGRDRTVTSPQQTARESTAPRNELSLVLTVALLNTGRDDNDLTRLNLLFRSMESFFPRDLYNSFLIVTPSSDFDQVKGVVGSFARTLGAEVINEEDICPELASNPNTLNGWPRPNLGWQRQQLIKLAAHKHMPSAYYMTLDSDIIFTRPVTAERLFCGGRGRLGTISEAGMRSLFVEELCMQAFEARRGRMRQAEWLLKVKRSPSRSGAWYAETPVILSRQVVADLTNYLECQWARPWRTFLLEHAPWTEYAIYGLYAEIAGLLDTCHEVGGMNSILNLTNSLWEKPESYRIRQGLEEWDASSAFDPGADGVAIAIQSYLGYPIEAIERKVVPFLK